MGLKFRKIENCGVYSLNNTKIMGVWRGDRAGLGIVAITNDVKGLCAAIVAGRYFDAVGCRVSGADHINKVFRAGGGVRNVMGIRLYSHSLARDCSRAFFASVIRFYQPFLW